jgi:hypothetical protein
MRRRACGWITTTSIVNELGFDEALAYTSSLRRDGFAIFATRSIRLGSRFVFDVSR